MIFNHEGHEGARIVSTMKFTPSAFGNDHLQLSRWELVKLFFGRRLVQGALIVECSPAQSSRPVFDPEKYVSCAEQGAHGWRVMWMIEGFDLSLHGARNEIRSVAELAERRLRARVGNQAKLQIVELPDLGSGPRGYVRMRPEAPGK